MTAGPMLPPAIPEVQVARAQLHLEKLPHRTASHPILPGLLMTTERRSSPDKSLHRCFVYEDHGLNTRNRMCHARDIASQNCTLAVSSKAF